MSNKMLIVAATAAEIEPFLNHYQLTKQTLNQHLAFDVLITGVGAWATTFQIARYINPKNYLFMLNVGIAGSFHKNLNLGDLAYIQEDYFADFGAEDKDSFLSAESLNLGKNAYPAPNYKVILPTPLHRYIEQLPQLKAITVQTAHGNKESIKTIQERICTDLESMEGAAVFYAAELLNLPAFQIRSISNYVEPRNRAAWEIGKAISNLNSWLISFTQALNEK